MKTTATITEAQFLKMVLTLMKLHHWRTFHQRPGQMRSGKWCSAVQGDGVGWPDIFAVRHERAIACELKVANRKPTPEQAEWLRVLKACGVETWVWRPEMWEEICDVLA